MSETNENERWRKCVTPQEIREGLTELHRLLQTGQSGANTKPIVLSVKHNDALVVRSIEKRSPTQIEFGAAYANGVKIGGPGAVTVQHDAEQSTPKHKPAHRDESATE